MVEKSSIIQILLLSIVVLLAIFILIIGFTKPEKDDTTFRSTPLPISSNEDLFITKNVVKTTKRVSIYISFEIFSFNVNYEVYCTVMHIPQHTSVGSEPTFCRAELFDKASWAEPSFFQKRRAELFAFKTVTFLSWLL